MLTVAGRDRSDKGRDWLGDCCRDLFEQDLLSATQGGTRFEFISIKLVFRSMRMSEITYGEGVTNYHKLGGTHLSSNGSGNLKSEISFNGIKSRCQQEEAPSRGFRGECIPVPFPAFRAAFLHLQSQQLSILLQLSHSLLL